MTQQDLSSHEQIIARGRLAVKVLFWVNFGVAGVEAILWLTPWRTVGMPVTLVVMGVQLLLALVWFLPVLVFHWFIKRRRFLESSCLALWSFVEVIGAIAP